MTGPSWGGNLETLHWNLAVHRWMRPVEDYAGCVLLLEISEELPSAHEVFRMLRNAGERGLLAQFPAVIVGLPKATNLQRHHPAEVRERYRADQRDAVLSVFARYSPDTMIVFDVDIGHTDPQWVLPYGGNLTIDGPSRRISAHWRTRQAAVGRARSARSAHRSRTCCGCRAASPPRHRSTAR